MIYGSGGAYGIRDFNRNISRPLTAFEYVITPTDPGLLVLTPDQLRTLLDVDAEDLTDDEANALTKEAQTWAESYTGIILFDSTVVTFRDGFFFQEIELRQFPINYDAPELIIEFIEDGVLMPFVTTDIVGVARRSFFSYLYLFENEEWPDADRQTDSVKITFKAGFEDVAALPPDLVAGIGRLAVWLFENPGDCPCDASGAGMPADAKRLLKFYKPISISKGY